MIQDHRDIAAQRFLDFDRKLWRQIDRTPIDMRLEMSSLFTDLRLLCKAEDLKSAGIGKDRSIPTNKAMQPSEVANPLMSWTQGEVIGVTKQHRNRCLPQPIQRNTLNRSLRTDGHKNRRFHRAVWCTKKTRSRRTVGRFQPELDAIHREA